ncbi:MAG: HNH endonuclease [Caldilineaceae bacterium]|nr:HNH endonuclease [Caldilineaceae bacterium]
MSTTYISAQLRRLVAQRANLLCEYCLIHDDDTYWGCQIDHIVSEKHGGATTAENLAHACPFCNRNKGSDVGSFTQDGQLVRLFNPRIDWWTDHFRLDGVAIIPQSDIGEVTARIFGFNQVDRLLERQELQALGRYPTPEAFTILEQ